MSPQSVTRRRFLRSATAAIAIPTIISSPLRSALRATPGNRLTIGMIGLGKRGHRLLGNLLANPEVQVVAVAEVERTRRESAKHKIEEHYGKQERKGNFKGADAYVDFRNIIQRDDIEAVVIATPDHWHAIPAVEAAKARKDIYCEKPLSLTIHEARVIADTARRHGVIFQTGSQQRSEMGGRFRHACELVRNGRIGRVHTALVNVGGPGRDCELPAQECPDNVDWNLWLGPAPERPYNEALCPGGMHDHYPDWRQYWDYAGGMMTDWGAHHFDIVQWGLGMDDSGPVEIIPPEGDRTRIRYRYANDVIVHHSGSSIGAKFIGENGWVDVNRGELRTFPDKLKNEKIGEKEIHLYKADNHLGNWLECVRSRRQPICNADIGARSVTVCHLGNFAYRYGRRLRWDPVKWEFIGDREANTWRERPLRDPWKLDAGQDT